MNSVPDLTWLFVRMLVALALVLGLAVVGVRFILPRLRIGRSKVRAWLTLIDRQALDSRKSLYLVKIAGRYFVLGGSEHSLSVITELPALEGEKIETP